MKIAVLRWSLPGFFLIFQGLFFISVGVAEEQDDSVFVMPKVTVVGTHEDEDHLSGKSRLPEDWINALPVGNGNINELLNLMPSVQTSETANISTQGGEIIPPNLSISGGRFYDNNFMIDGVDNNSVLDPAGNDPESIQNIPGYSQEIFLDYSLLDELIIYRNNIPAEFGGFTGGVVVAKTKQPGPQWNGKVDLRTTRSAWTSFHVDNENEDGFNDSNSSEQQPKFSKYNGGFLLNAPIAEGMGLLASYRNLHSKIPLRHFGTTQDQTRDIKTYFVKYSYDISERTAMRLTFIQTPFEDKRFKNEMQGSEIKDSWYVIKRGGYRLTTELSHFFAGGELEVVGGYRDSENSRQAPTSFYSWNTRPSNWVGEWDKDWGTKLYSKEGGYGDLESSQESESVDVDFTVEPFATGVAEHKIKLGYGFERVTGTFERKDLTYNYSVAKTDAKVICGDNEFDCIDGQQYMWFRNVYEPDSINETIDLHHAYIQDSLQLKRLTLRPGYRISTDNFMDNVDHDLRLAGSFDLFGSGETLLIGGVNRYHSHSLLTYKLAEAKKPMYIEKRSKDSTTNLPTPWTLVSKSTLFTKYSELDTPYSDEWNVGFDQALFGGRLKAQYVERRNKDEFATETSEKDAEGNRYSTLNNNGRSKHNEVSVDWERNWENHYLSLNVTWQETESSNDDYWDLLDLEELSEEVYYHGQLIRRVDLPRTDYNRAYVGNLIYSVSLPYGFTFTNHTRYRGRFEYLDDTGEDQTGPDGEPISVYDQVEQPEAWTFDWKLLWRRNLYRNHGLQLSLEVYNVFDEKVVVRSSETAQDYELGRQFWVGMEYYF